MQVILLERVEKLGAIGDVVTVRDGFARNFLLPKHKALRATEANKRKFEARKDEIIARNAELREAAAKGGEKLDGQQFVLIRSAGESGQLYGSVSARDIADAAGAAGFKVERQYVVLDKPIKTLGVFPLKVRLHAEVLVNVSVNVARSAEEAERQAKGENVIQSAMDADRAAADEQAKEIAANTLANEGPGGEG
jgi:large subunit ribosomal protein L9